MFGWFKKQPQPQAIKKRGFSAAKINRLTADWTTTSSTPNSDVYAGLSALRARSRDLIQNNGYAKKYASSMCTNIIGRAGITLQATSKDPSGKLDKSANDQIESAFKAWGDICDVAGKQSWIDVQNAIVHAMVQDGEALIRMVRGYKNDFSFAIQLIESDHLDVNLNDEKNNIVMGVEMDEYGKPIAYHLLKQHPSAATYQSGHIRINADEIIHLFIPLRIGQVRGVPMMHAGMSALDMFGKYQEAELTAARVAAAKMGFYTTPTGEEYNGEKDGDDVIMEVSPGSFEELPTGWGFQSFDPQHPTTAYAAFSKEVLRSISAAWGISYETLSNDLEGVNYSSIRQGVLAERETYRYLQGFISRQFHNRIYNEFLPLAILNGKLNLPFSKIDKFSSVTWNPRGYQWVDPLKDANANIVLSNAGLKTHQDIVSESGKDIEDVYAQLAKEKQMRDELGIIVQYDADLLEITQGATTNENQE